MIPTPPLEARLAEDRVECVRCVLPLHFLAYEQIGFRGTLGWTVVATGKYYEHEFAVRNQV